MVGDCRTLINLVSKPQLEYKGGAGYSALSRPMDVADFKKQKVFLSSSYLGGGDIPVQSGLKLANR